MFIFNRVLREGSAEVFDVLIPENSLKDSEKRFGMALKCNSRETLYHEVGKVIFIHRDKKVEYFVFCKSEFEIEESCQFYQELEFLAGYEVGGGMSDSENPDKGWFVHDFLKPW